MVKRRTICWTPTWNKDREGIGLEHLVLDERVAGSIVLAFDEEHGPFRLMDLLAPFTNTFPIRREPMVVGQRRNSSWLGSLGPLSTVHPQPQAYTRLADRVYLFETLDRQRDSKRNFP